MKRFKQILFFTALSCGLYLTACQKEAASPSTVKKTLVKGSLGGNKDTIIVTRTIKKDTIIVTRADD
ncbi:hypothetical protein [Mucilaginibacter sp.]|jgi:hypothetical protein|uniref:hypothetical protein n=1 Tax=Mucilaginibacter sp. TaxID=1882438 RepID=UPI002603BB5C|nr:hypothetical protein [Mucilaginibacter sp.]MDB5126395.1 hypothetical protein [Mucilaginibacter sp.]